MKPQGNGFSQLVQLMRQHGYNKDLDIEIGTVKAPPPEVEIQLDSMQDFHLYKGDLVFASRVVETPLKQGDRVIVACNEAQTTFYVLDKAVRY